MKKLIFTIAIVAIAQCSTLAQNFEWATRGGGTSTNEAGHGIATDAAGNCYVTGRFTGTAEFENITLTSSVEQDIFIAKLDTNGIFLWATRAGGPSTSIGEAGYGIATDAAGNSYITGEFKQTADFGSTSLTSASADYSDIFIAKLDTDGNFLWAKRAGGTLDDVGWGIATDATGNCYVTGYFQDAVEFGGTSLTSSGNYDIFITKLDTDGNFLWAKRAGASTDDKGNNIDTDAAGNCYLTGYFQGTADFGSITLTSAGSLDIFITKLDTEGNFLWAKRAGGTATDFGYGIASDNLGNSYVTGTFIGSATFGSTSFTSVGATTANFFITKLDTDGNFLWTKNVVVYGRSNSIAIDASGNFYITGSFQSTAEFGSTSLTASDEDIFIAKLDTEGNFVWAKRAGGTMNDVGYDITSDATGNCYVTGYFKSTADFGATTLTSAGEEWNWDIFITKLTNETTPTSISHLFVEKEVKLYPNPANSFISIQTDEALKTISIYNITGELLQTETHNSFSIEHLPAGVYMLQIQTEKGITTTRMIKE